MYTGKFLRPVQYRTIIWPLPFYNTNSQMRNDGKKKNASPKDGRARSRRGGPFDILFVTQLIFYWRSYV
jgi:hypothetical protein